MQLPRIAVATTDPSLESKAIALANRLTISFIATPFEEWREQYDFALVMTPHHLGIQKTLEKKLKPFYIDFLSGKLHYRGAQASLRREMIAKAMGVKPNKDPFIVDATAGLGRDSFILAVLGYSSVMLEKSPIVHALLEDALTRLAANREFDVIAARLRLINADATKWLPLQAKKPNIVYLDPMFPSREKTASVKKEMVILQEILQKDANSQILLETALTCAIDRTVVKRPRVAPPLGGFTPNYSLAGKSSRFDIYLPTIAK